MLIHRGRRETAAKRGRGGGGELTVPPLLNHTLTNSEVKWFRFVRFTPNKGYRVT